jgi:hypothetical protein
MSARRSPPTATAPLVGGEQPTMLGLGGGTLIMMDRPGADHPTLCDAAPDTLPMQPIASAPPRTVPIPPALAPPLAGSAPPGDAPTLIAPQRRLAWAEPVGFVPRAPRPVPTPTPSGPPPPEPIARRPPLAAPQKVRQPSAPQIAVVVAIAFLVTIVVLAAGGFGAYLLWRSPRLHRATAPVSVGVSAGPPCCLG